MNYITQKNTAFHLGKYIGINIYLPGFNIWCPTSEKWHLDCTFCDGKGRGMAGSSMKY